VEHVLRTLSIYKYTINERGAKFRRLCVFCIFRIYSNSNLARPQYTLKLKKMHGSSGMHEPACMLAAAAAAAAAGCCWLLLLLLAAAVQQPVAAASSSSSSQHLPAAAAASMHAGSCMPDEPCVFLNPRDR
jgi:hypothetical protein